MAKSWEKILKKANAEPLPLALAECFRTKEPMPVQSSPSRIPNKAHSRPGELQDCIWIYAKRQQTCSREPRITIRDPNQQHICHHRSGGRPREREATGISSVGNACPEENADAGADVNNDGEEL